MKAKYLAPVMFAFAALYVMRCTGAVAPKNEGTTATTDTSAGSSTKTSTKSSTASDTETTDTSSGSSSSSSSSSASNTDTGSAALGEITETTNEIADFKPVNAFAYYSAGSSKYLSISATESYAEEENMEKAATEYTCTACEGATDPHCAGSTAFSITFMAGLGADADANGLPAADSTTRATTTTYTGMTIAVGTDQFSGTVTFVGERPAAAGDTFELDVDAVNGAGKKYKAKIKGKVFTTPTSTATYPTCGADEYVKSTY